MCWSSAGTVTVQEYTPPIQFLSRFQSTAKECEINKEDFFAWLYFLVEALYSKHNRTRQVGDGDYLLRTDKTRDCVLSSHMHKHKGNSAVE